jgi:pyruvate, water dikinase
MTEKEQKLILWFSELSRGDGSFVGGKNSSLGEMYSNLTQQEINVPNGFATTSFAYWQFLEKNGLPSKLEKIFKTLDSKNIKNVRKIGAQARDLILSAKFPQDFENELLQSYRKLCEFYGEKNVDVAVRSSATAEDLPNNSFAGQHETFLDIRGEERLLEAVKKCIASLFNDRAIVYRVENGFDHFKIALSVGVMKMVRSDKACSGVMFSLDTETGFRDVTLINGSWGLGEMVVKGMVVPDEFLVFEKTLDNFRPIISRNLGSKKIKLIYGKNGPKQVNVLVKDQQKFILNDQEILQLAKWAVAIENHYGTPMDIEWAKDGKSGKLFIVQARPETIHTKVENSYIQYELRESGKILLTGESIGSKIASGKVTIIPSVTEIEKFQPGGILVTKMTDPDWTSVMAQAKAIITEEGGRTCHAAIVSRELGIPCIVGGANAMKVLKNGQSVTVDCSAGQEGKVFGGELKFEIVQTNLESIPQTKTKLMLNVGQPDMAFKHSFLPNSGVGLAREEFIIAAKIKIHPLALIGFSKLKDKKIKNQITELTSGYTDKKEFFLEKLAEGVGKIGAAFYPKPVIVRFSDFKSNEYAQLLGGKSFEPEESNPMIGFRGASRYYSQEFQPAFEMECRAIKKVREEFGLTNVWAMVPFCRTVEEGKKVLEIMEKNGLKKGENGLKVIVMCEIPSNVILAEEFLEIFDGMSIGSNDLTQLMLGLDRDSSLMGNIGNEKNEAVKKMISMVIKVCREKQKYIGICGEAPSNFPDFAEFLIEQGIESMSLNPDTIIKTTLIVAEKEKNLNNKSRIGMESGEPADSPI